jgi:DNA invertase Pin-like site-specific DNA recombinase
MTKEKNRLKKMAVEQNKEIEEILLPLLNSLGSQKLVAKKLNVAESTISLWLRNNGFVEHRTWQRHNSQINERNVNDHSN